MLDRFRTSVKILKEERQHPETAVRSNEKASVPVGRGGIRVCRWHAKFTREHLEVFRPIEGCHSSIFN